MYRPHHRSWHHRLDFQVGVLLKLSHPAISCSAGLARSDSVSWEATRVQSLDSLGSGTGKLLVPVHVAVGVIASVRVAVSG